MHVSWTRNIVGLMLGLLLVVLSAAPTWAAENNLSGRYEVEKTFYTVYADIKHKGSKICLAAFIHTLIGTNYTYHFYGTITGNKVFAKHPNGHTLTGTISKDGVLTGVVRTRGGDEYDIEAGPKNRVTEWSDHKKRPSKCKL